MGYWDIYNTRLAINGSTQRERNVNQLKHKILNKVSSNPSYKAVKLNGEEASLVINSGNKSYIKEFQTLPGQSVLCGDYVEWANRTWLVYEADADDEIYIDGKMYECNYVQHWQNDNGDLIVRPSFVTNASAYNNGESGNSTLTLASNQFMVWMPIDEETLKIRNGKRVFMDNYTTEPSCYELTRPDNVSMKFGEKGCTYYIFTQTPKDDSKDKLITLEDGTRVWIADYHSPTPSPNIPDETTDLSASIVGVDSLKIGFAKIYKAEFKDSNGNVLSNIDFQWNVVSDFEVVKTINADDISLRVDDEDYIDSSFLLQIIKDNTVISEKIITVSYIF